MSALMTEDSGMTTKLKNLDQVKGLVARLANMDPQDEAVKATVEGLQDQVGLLNEQAREDKDSPWGSQSMKDDVSFIKEQIQKLKSAAAIPASNYRRIYEIASNLERAWDHASKPQNVGIRPQLQAAVAKVAGIFAEVDTVADLDKPLEAIEKAVHSVYGDQSKNSTFYFQRRNKGHHGKD